MIDFGDYGNENETEHNLKRPYIPDNPYRILTIEGSGSGKNECIIKYNKQPAKYL